jgi:hypothetical protein
MFGCRSRISFNAMQSPVASRMSSSRFSFVRCGASAMTALRFRRWSAIASKSGGNFRAARAAWTRLRADAGVSWSRAAQNSQMFG